MNVRDYKKAAERRKALEQQQHIDLSHTGKFTFDETISSTKNCENMIGATQVPLGIAGPLSMNGERAKGEFFIPLATTEGALVASVSRGCKAVNLSEGISVYTCRAGQTRGPVFLVKSLAERKKLYSWIKNNEERLKAVAEKTSRYLKFKKAAAQGVARYLFVRFSFETGDAMGMNMVTIATQAMAELIEKETGAELLAVAGNFDIDKKPAWLNFINNRGFAAWAEIVVKKNIVKKVLKTTSEKIFDVWLSKCMIGSALSGSLGMEGTTPAATNSRERESAPVIGPEYTGNTRLFVIYSVRAL